MKNNLQDKYQKNINTVVIDGGARYGLHPTWKNFNGELKYYMFEPDEDESKRLKEKYKNVKNTVYVTSQPLTKYDNEKITIHFFENKAMSSSQKRNETTEVFLGEKKNQVNIEYSNTYQGISIDTFCITNNINLDFLKLDTEGSEFSILEGAKKQLSEETIGVRSEVAFDNIFEEMPQFGQINDFLSKYNFFLLNLDYTGKGDCQNDFINPCERYGVLTNTDAVWLRRYDVMIDKESDNILKIIKTLKYAYFCFLNNAPDIALHTLTEGIKKYHLNYNLLNGTQLFKNIKIVIKKHLYSLKWIPGLTLEAQYDLYRYIFNEEIEKMHNFMSSLDLNPA